MVYFYYALESAIIMNVLYLLYWLLLRNDTFFKTNRLFLILSLLVSIVIPLVDFDLNNSIELLQNIPITRIVINNDNVLESNTANEYSVFSIVVCLYIGVSSILLFKFLLQIASVFNVITKCSKEFYNSNKVLIFDGNISPFSFFKAIIIPKRLVSAHEFNKVFMHESLHAKQLHSIDIILIEIISIIFWFNPIVYLYKRSFNTVHEYLADDYLIDTGCDKVEYQELLFTQCFNDSNYSITNNFNKSLTKNRFIMMSKQKTQGVKRVKLFVVLPVLLMFVMIFSCNSGDQQVKLVTNTIDVKSYKSKLVSDLNNELVFPEYVMNPGYMVLSIRCVVKSGVSNFSLLTIKGKDMVKRMRDLKTGYTKEMIIPGELDVEDEKVEEAKSYFFTAATKSLNKSSAIKEIAKKHVNGVYDLEVVFNEKGF